MLRGETMKKILAFAFVALLTATAFAQEGGAPAADSSPAAATSGKATKGKKMKKSDMSTKKGKKKAKKSAM